ncbi:hypothetical protein JKP88DRAFT_349622 [Tribonema minus]|uniref:Uncharacterized protein n=1 Tax=Tribonema minus TaxID=303371 RepID=A0A835YVK2_9STRA|nr:hypothetical protein JKP88DRAFT_349622 [Tribonema minus]
MRISEALLAVTLLAAGANARWTLEADAQFITEAPTEAPTSPAPTAAPTPGCLCETVTLTGVPDADPAPLCPGVKYDVPVVTAEDNCGNARAVDVLVDYSTNSGDRCATAIYTFTAACPLLDGGGGGPDEVTRVTSRGVTAERIRPVVTLNADADCHYTAQDFVTDCAAAGGAGAYVDLKSVGIAGDVCTHRCRPGGVDAYVIAANVCGDPFDFVLPLDVCSAAEA